MPGMPPLQLSASSSASNGPFGAGGNGWSSGDWNINLGGSGAANQAAGGALPLTTILLLVGAAWLLLKA